MLEAALYRRGVKFEEEEQSGETDPSIIAVRSLERYSVTFANLNRHETALSTSLLRTLVSSLHHLKMDLNLGAVGRRTLGRKRPAGSVGRRAH
jgi:hypothetical protein